MTPDEKFFWVAILLLTGMFATGLFLVFDHLGWGLLFVVTGLVGSLLTLRDRAAAKTDARIDLALAIGLATWLTLGYAIYDRHHENGLSQWIPVGILVATLTVVACSTHYAYRQRKLALTTRPMSMFEQIELQNTIADTDKQILTLSGKRTWRMTDHPLTVQRAYADLASSPHASYKDKIRIILTNTTGREMHVWAPVWESKEVHVQTPFAAKLQLESTVQGGGWKVGAWFDEQQCIIVPPGQTFMSWIGLLPPIGDGLQRRIENRTTGTAVFPIKVDGSLYEVPIRL
jgi:hypothetical protein